MVGSDNADQWWLGAYTTNSFGNITLKEGKNTITLALKTNEINLDYMQLRAAGTVVEDPFTFDYSDGMKVELEETNFSGATVQNGASGKILGITSSATKLEFNVVADEDMYVEFLLNGLIKVDSEYSEIAGRRFALMVNDEVVDLSAQTLVGSDNADQWWLGSYTTNSLGCIALKEGKNTIVLSLKTGEINLDYVTLVAGEAPEKEPFTYNYSEGMKIEVEDTNFVNATVQSGASGNILGITTSATKLEFTVVAEEEMTVELFLNGLFKVGDGYSGTAGDRFVLTVNGVEVDLSAKTLVGSDNADQWWLGTYTTNSFGKITLQKGKNTITLALKTNEINLDYIQLN